MELQLKHIAPYLPYNLNWHLPLTSERYESILENECYGVIEIDWAIENNYPNAEDYLRMTFSQSTPFIAIEDDMLFLGQMKSSLGWEEDDVYLNEMKPVLRNLSDLTKQIEVNGEKFIPFERIAIYSSVEHLIDQIQTGLVEVIVYNMLVSWHFDVHNLIASDLAIDANTLNQK